MGRGLSDLQKTILRQAFARPDAYYASFAEILGPNATHSDRAALSRSVERLRHRGLVDWVPRIIHGTWISEAEVFLAHGVPMTGLAPLSFLRKTLWVSVDAPPHERIRGVYLTEKGVARTAKLSVES